MHDLAVSHVGPPLATCARARWSITIFMARGATKGHDHYSENAASIVRDMTGMFFRTGGIPTVNAPDVNDDTEISCESRASHRCLHLHLA